MPVKDLLRFPRFVSIEVIDFCNARCVMCGVDPDKRSRRKMPPIIFDKILRELATHAGHVRWVSLGGNGEATADTDLEAKVLRLKQAGMRSVQLTTNASLLTEKRSTGLLRAGIDHIRISLDSLDKETFETIRVGLSFDEVYGNIQDCIKARDELRPEAEIRIQMVEQELNAGEQEAFVKHWTPQLRGHDRIVIDRVFGWGHYRDPASATAAANAVPCITLWGSLDIYASGKAHLCCNDTDGDIVVGDVRTHSLAEIWNGPRLTEVRQRHLDGRRHTIDMCNGCTTFSESKHSADGPGTRQC